jgi:hypothetical protein
VEELVRTRQDLREVQHELDVVRKASSSSSAALKQAAKFIAVVQQSMSIDII